MGLVASLDVLGAVQALYGVLGPLSMPGRLLGPFMALLAMLRRYESPFGRLVCMPGIAAVVILVCSGVLVPSTAIAAGALIQTAFLSLFVCQNWAAKIRPLWGVTTTPPIEVIGHGAFFCCFSR